MFFLLFSGCSFSFFPVSLCSAHLLSVINATMKLFAAAASASLCRRCSLFNGTGVRRREMLLCPLAKTASYSRILTRNWKSCSWCEGDARGLLSVLLWRSFSSLFAFFIAAVGKTKRSRFVFFLESTTFFSPPDCLSLIDAQRLLPRSFSRIPCSMCPAPTRESESQTLSRAIADGADRRGQNSSSRQAQLASNPLARRRGHCRCRASRRDRARRPPGPARRVRRCARCP